MKKNSVYDCSIIELDKHHHEKGNITVVESGVSVTFGINNIRRGKPLPVYGKGENVRDWQLLSEWEDV